MLPDYLIYDELKKRREQEELEKDRQRPRLHMPRYFPLLPEEEEGWSEEADSDVIIIKM